MIRHSLDNFVDYWNNHKIRSQKGRDHVHTGIPREMWTGEDKREDVVNCQVFPDTTRLAKLTDLAAMDSVDLLQYLPKEVQLLCDLIMERYDGPEHVDHQRPLLQRYEFLRNALTLHAKQEKFPPLALLDHSSGGWDTFKDTLKEQGLYIDRLGKVHVLVDEELERDEILEDGQDGQ